MKRAPSFAIAIVVIALNTSAMASSPSSAPDVYGDITGNGKVNVADLQCFILTAKWAIGGVGSAPACLVSEAAADLNCNGEINVVDYQLMLIIAPNPGAPLNPAIDSNQDGVHDSCQGAAEPTCGYADLNCSGGIDVVDLQCFILTINAVVSGAELPACLAADYAADLNCNGEVNVVDYQLMIQKTMTPDAPLNPAIDADQDGVHDDCQAPAEAEAEGCGYADLTCDGLVNVVDVQCFRLSIGALMSGAETPQCLADEGSADLNCNGKVNVVDYQLMIMKAMQPNAPLNPAIDADQNGVHDACE